MTNQPTYEELLQKVMDLEKEVVERKQVEEALCETEEKYRALFETTRDKIFVNELRKHRKHLEELNCKRNDELNKINNALQLEIENRKQVEEKTKIAYAELYQIFNSNATGIRLIDENFNVLKLNQSFLILSGIISMDGAKGKKCYETFPCTLCNTPMCTLTKILGGDEHIEMEVEKKRIDGTTIPCILTAAPIRGHGGELIGMVEHLTDITQRKKVENELQDTLKELRQAL